MAAGEVEGHLEGKRLVDAARQQAAAILDAAHRDAAAVAADAAGQAREAEHAKMSALYLALSAERERRAQADLDRAVSLAVLLAERLLGQALEQHPQRIAALARQALVEARGARRATIEAHPLDAEALQRHLKDVVESGVVVDVRVSTELTRGSLRVHTNLGTLDAQLTPQLERLAQALRDALEP